MRHSGRFPDVIRLLLILVLAASPLCATVGHAAPVLVMESNEYETDLLTGQTDDFTLNISNAGNSVLNWSSKIEIIQEGRDADGRGLRNVNGAAGGPQRDNAGDLIASFDNIDINNAGQYSSCVGWDPDNNQMWVTNYSTSQIAAYTHDGNYANFRETVRIGQQSMDGTFANGLAWIMPWGSNVVNRFDPHGNNVGAWNSPFALYGLGWDKENNWLIAMSTDFIIRVYQLSADNQVGNLLGTIQAASHTQYHQNTAYGLEWVSKHADTGKLWMFNSGNGHIYQIAVDEQNWVCTGSPQNFSVMPNGAGDQPYCSVAHDGYNLWASGYNPSDIRIYDDGITEAYWLAVDPKQGNLNSGSDVNVNIHFNAAGLVTGTYIGDIHFLSNDPRNADQAFRAVMNVTGAPVIEVKWAAADGWVDGDGAVLDWNRHYDPNLFTNGPYDMHLAVKNIGTDDLDVQSLSIDNDYFSVTPDEFVLAPKASQIVTVTLNVPADQPGEYQPTLTIVNNDHDAGEYHVPLHAFAHLPPVLVMDSNEYETDLLTGETEDYTLNLSNQGDARCDWESKIEIIQEHGRDANARSLRNVNGPDAAGPQRDDAGDLLGTFTWNRSPAQVYKAGIAYDWDNDLIMLTAYSPNWMAVVSPEDYHVIREWQPGGNPMGCAWLGGVFYTIGWANMFLMKYDINGNNLGQWNINVQATSVTASADLNVILVGDGGGNRDIYVYNPDGQRLATMARGNYAQYIQNTNQRSLCWVDKHPNGQLWMNSPGHIYQVAVNTDDWQATGAGANWATNAQNPQEWDGIGHDKHNLIYGPWGEANYRIYDDGVTEAYWLSVDPAEGQLESGSDVNVNIHLDAAGLFTGTYIGDIHILSNDPANLDQVFRATVNVTGAPDIQVKWAAADGWVNGEGAVLDWNPRYDPNLFTNADYPEHVQVKNVGTDDLDVQDVSVDNNYFVPTPDHFVLGPGAVQDVTIIMHIPQNEPGVYEPTLTFTSNDADHGQYNVQIHAHAFAPPVLVMDANEYETDLLTGANEDYTLNLANQGDARLDWSTTVEVIQEGRRDANTRSLRNVSGEAAPVDPKRDDPGQVLNEYRIDWPAIVGLAWDEDHSLIWGYKQQSQNAGQGTDGTIFAFDPGQERVVASYDGIVDHRDGLAYYDQHLYIDGSTWDGSTLFEYDLQGNLTNRINMPFGIWPYNFTITAVNHEPYFMMRGDDYHGGPGDAVEVYSWPNLDHIASIRDADVTGDRSTCGIMFVEADKSGQLWVDCRDHLDQVKVNDDWSCEFVQRFGVQGTSERAGMTHDKYNIWRCVRMWQGGGQQDDHTMLQKIDDGVGETYWFTYDPQSGSLESGSDVNLNLHFDASGLYTGTYINDLHFISNDPAGPDQVFRAIMNVTGAPDIEVTWEAADGWVNGDGAVLDWNPRYDPNLFTNGDYPLHVTVKNVGTDDLDVQDVSANNDYFVATPDHFVLAPTATQDVTVVMHIPQNEPGVYEPTLTFTSNDADHGAYHVQIHAHAFAPPVLVMDSNEYETDLFTGQTEDYTLNLSNQGDARCDWNSKIEIIQEGGRDANTRSLRNVSGTAGPTRPQRDNAGDLIASFDGIDVNEANQYSSCVGWDPENHQMWITNYISSQIGAYTFDGDYQNFRQTVRIGQQSMDGTFANGLAWIMPWGSNVVNRFDPRGNNVGAWNSPNALYGLGWDAANNWIIAMGTDMIIRVYQNSDNNQVGAELGEISAQSHTQYHQNTAYGLEWVSKHADTGKLWMFNSGNGHIYQIAVNEQNWTCTGSPQNFSVMPNGAADQPYSSVAWDGHNLWASGYTPSDIRIYDDGITEAYWLGMDPKEGQLQSGSDVNVNIHLDAAGLLGGTYIGDLHFLSNDPANADQVFRATVNVTGVADIEVKWAVGDGWVDGNGAVLDWNRHYDPNLFTGGPYDMHATVKNAGTDDLDVQDVAVDNDYFTATPDHFVLAPGASQIVTVTMNVPADRPDTYEPTLTFTSNDPDEGEYNVQCHAQASLPPILVMDSNEYETDLFTGQTEDYTLNLSNQGQALCVWDSDIEIIQEQGRDVNARSLRNVSGTSGPVRPQRDNPGDVIAQFQGGVAANVYKNGCYDPDDDWLIENSYNNPYDVYIYDLKNNYQLVRHFTFAGAVNPMDIAYYNGTIYVMSLWNALLQRFDLNGQNLGNINLQNHVGINGVAISAKKEVILAAEGLGDPHNLDVFDFQGNRIARIGSINPFVNNTVFRSIEWVDKHEGGELWVNTANRAWQIDVDTDNWTFVGNAAVSSFATRSGIEYAMIAHDRHNMWVSEYSTQTLYCYDDGVTEAYWLAIDPTEGQLQSGSDENVNIHLDAASLLGGTYIGDIHFTSNDPANPDQVFRATINVTGMPDIEVKWAAADGWAEGDGAVLNWNRHYDPNLFTGGPYDMHVKVKNVGTDDLDVQNIGLDNEFFTATPDHVVLAPGASQDVTVTMNIPANRPDTYEPTLTFTSNDPDEAEYNVQCHAQASLPPILVMDSNEYETDLFTGETEDYTLNLSNQGEALCVWDSKIEIVQEGGRDANTRSLRNVSGATGPVRPQRDNAGDLIASFDNIDINNAGQYSSCVGWDPDNNQMWVTNYITSQIAAYTFEGDYQNFRETVRIAQQSMDGTFANGLAWIMPWGSNVVNRFDPRGNNVGAWQAPNSLYGLGWDKENNWIIAMGTDMIIRVYQNSDNNQVGALLGSIPAQSHTQYHVNTAYGLEWVSKHADTGKLWMFNSGNGHIYQIAVDEQNWVCTGSPQNFSVMPNGAADQPYSSVAWDGHNMWASGYNPSDIRIYDDGITEAYWIALDPKEGQLQSGSDVNVNIHFDAAALIGGTYIADLHFRSNDPANSDQVFRATLNVTGRPAIEVKWAAGDGWEEGDGAVLDWNRHYDPNLFTGGPYDMHVKVKDVGTDDLDVQNVAVDNEFFTATPDHFVIAPGEIQDVTVTMNIPADRPDTYEPTLTFTSNDPVVEEYHVQCHAQAALPPVFVMDSNEYETDLVIGQTDDYTLNLSNQGEARCVWDSDIEIIQEAGRDANARALRNVNSAVGPRRDDLGEQLGTFTWNRAAANQYKAGIAYDWDNDLLVLTTYSPNWMAVVDPNDNYRVVREWQPNGNPMGCAWLNGVLYTVCWANNVLSEYDINGNNVGQFNTNNQPTSVTTSKELNLVFASSGGNDDIGIFNPANAQQIATLSAGSYGQFIGGIWQRSLCWFDKDKDGQLWMNKANNVYELSVDTDNWTATGLVQHFSPGQGNPQDWDGLGHDKHNLIYGAYGAQNYIIYDDNVTEAYWLSIDPTDGVLQSGSDENVNIHLDATGLVGGTYIGDIHFTSNDPSNPDQVFRVTVNAAGAPAVETDPVCSPFEGAQPVSFAATFVNGETSLPVVLRSVGTDDLEIGDISSNNQDEFTTDLEPGAVIAAGERLTFHLLFHPVDVGERQGTIQIATNARNLPEGNDAGLIWFDMAGTGQTPPGIQTNPEAGGWIAVGLPVGADPETRTLTITNAADQGGADLTWQLKADEVQQGRDASQRSLRNVNGAAAISGPRRDNPGDVIGSIQMAHNGALGISRDFDSDIMWVNHTDQTNAMTNYWTAYHWDGQEITGIEHDFNVNFGANVFVLGGCYFNGVLYAQQWANMFIVRYDVDGNRMQDVQVNFYPMAFAIDWEHAYIYSNSYPDVVLHVLDINNNFQEVHNWQNFLGQGGNADCRGRLAWVPEHTTGHLWATFATAVVNGMTHAFQFSVNYDNWDLQLVQDFDVPSDVRSPGISHDGKNLWIGNNVASTITIIDDGISEVHWLDFVPKRGTLSQGQSEDVTLTFNSEGLAENTDYLADLTVSSNDPTNPSVVIHVDLRTGAVGPQPPYDQFTATASGHVLNVTGATWELNPLPTGWEIGVFTPDGVMSGGLYWFNDGQAHEFTAYGADENARGQFQQGQAFVFRFWDPNAQQERTTISENIAEGPATWVDGGRTTLTLDGRNYSTSHVNFLSGWNLISINVVPQQEFWVNEQGADIRRMMAQFHEGDQMHVVLMKDEGGNFYAPAIGDFCNIPFWNLGEGYQVKMDQDIAGEWTGAPIPAQTDLPISSGWNMIAYYPTYQLSATVGSHFYVVSPILDNVVIAKDAAGNFMVPRIPFSNMEPWTAGQGYQINVSQDVVLNYPEAQQRQASLPVESRNSAVVGHWADHARTGSNMSVLLSAFNGVKVAEGDQVAAFGTNDELVGLGTVTNGMCGLAVWGDDPTTDYVDGMKAGEAFTLKLWNAEREAEIGLNARITLGDGLCYKTDGFSVATASAVSAIPDNYYLGQNYPNPFNSVTRIAYGLPEASRVSIRVYNAVGQLVQTLVDSEQPAGHHRVSWNGSQISTGIYLVKMEAAGFSSTRKVVLVK